MKPIFKVISLLGLLLTILPSLLVFGGIIELAFHKTLMFVGMLCWFLTAPLWMNKNTPAPDKSA